VPSQQQKAANGFAVWYRKKRRRGGKASIS